MFLRPKHRTHHGRATDGGFAIAPILYLLGLIGVGAGVLFSGYSQILRSNQTMSNSLATKNDLQGTATTLAASSWLSTDQTLLCPPLVGSNSPNTPSALCSGAASAITVGTPFASATAANLPATAGGSGAVALTNFVASSGSPVEVGVFKAGSGAKVLDPWSHYYVYCRWENPIGTANAMMIISAGANGKLETKCGDTVAQGDDMFVVWTTAVTQNRAAVWQTVTSGTTVTGTQFGATGTQLNIDTLGDVTVPGTLNVSGDSTLANLRVTNLNGTDINAASGVLTTLSVGSSAQMSVGNTGNIYTTGMLGVTGLSNLGALTAGSSTLSAATITYDASVGGALGVTGATTLGQMSAGAASLNTLTVSNSGFFGGQVKTSTTGINIGTTVVATGSSQPLLTVGKPIGSPGVYPFTIDQFGAVVASQVSAGTFNGNLSGSQSGGSVSATTLDVASNSILSGDLSGKNANFNGTVSATTFTGGMQFGGGGVTVSGTLPIENGGTNATSASSALTNLFSAGVVSNVVPAADVACCISSAQLSTTGVTAGIYSSVTVGADGRITAGSGAGGLVSNLNDGSGDTVGIGTSGGGSMIITIGSSVRGNWTATGLMIGSSVAAVNKLDVNGATAIGAGYAGVATAPTDGLIVKGNVGIGVTSPVSALQVNGTVTATNFSGSGAGLTGLGTASISGILAPANGGTGTGTAFTQGSVVYAGASGNYAQDNANFFWDGGNHRLGIGTAVPASALSISGNMQATGSATFGIYGNGSTVTLGNLGNAGYVQVADANGITAQIDTNGNGFNLTYGQSTKYYIFHSNYLTTQISIGSSSDPANEISVYGNGSFGKDYITKSAPTNGLIVEGAVGIGTTSPATNLEVVSSGDVSSQLTTGSESNSAYLLLNTPGAVGRPAATAIMANGLGSYDRADIQFLLRSGANHNAAVLNTDAKMVIKNAGNVGIGTTSPNTAALLDVYSTTEGILPPRMTTVQRNAIGTASLPPGMMIYNTDNTELETYDGATYGWEAVGAYAQDAAGSNGQIQFNSNNALGADSNFNWNSTAHRLGIGTATMANALDIYGAQSIGYINTTAPSNGLIVSGKVGIGSSSPGNALDVGGTVYATNFIGSAAGLTGLGTASITGVLAPANGGTGDATLTAHGILIGQGTSPVTVTTPGTSGQLLIGQGASADPTFNTVSGDVTISNTGVTTIGATRVTNAMLAGSIDLTSKVTGILPVANGGTNASSAGITAFNNITGYTATGATGTTSTNLVFSASPTLTGTVTAANANFSGNVGIGTTVPQATLDVGGAVSFSPNGYASSQSAFDFTTPANNQSSFRIRETNTAYNSNYWLTFTTAATGNSITSGNYSALTVQGGIYSNGLLLNPSGANVGIGTTSMANKLDINGAASIGYVNTAAPSSGLIVSGNVGIGSSSPRSKLDVNGTAYATTFTGAHSGDGSGLTNIGTSSMTAVTGTANGTTYLRGDNTWGALGGGLLTGGVANYVPLWTGATALGTSTIYQSGSNVGIGSSSATTTLDVYGATTLRGNVTFPSAPTVNMPNKITFSDSSNGIGTIEVDNGNGASTFTAGNVNTNQTGNFYMTDRSSNSSYLSWQNNTTYHTMTLSSYGSGALTLAQGTMTFGNRLAPITQIYFNPTTDNNSAVKDTTLSGAYPSSQSSGTDVKGGNLTITGGQGRGTGTPGSLIFQTSTSTGTSGLTLQTLSERMRIDGSTGATGIGTTSPNAAALLDVFSTTKGILPPRMTTAQRNLISVGTAQIGLTVYNTDNAELESYDGVAYGWEAVGAYAQDAAGSTGQVQFNSSGSMNADSNFTWDNTNKRLGIGTTSPLSSLSVNGGAAIGTYAGLNAAGANNLIVSGNVGIGTTTIANKLDINGAASVGYVNTAAPSNGLIVSGNVGIGTTSPGSTLEVTGNISLSTGANRTISVPAAVGNNVSGNNLTLQAANGSTSSGATSGGNLNLQAGAMFKSSVAAGYGANVNITAGTNLAGGTAWGGDINFSTGNPSAVQMMVSGGSTATVGNVGIGSSSPSTKLDVSGVVRAGSGVQFGDGTTQTTAGGLSGGTANEIAMWSGTASIGTANIYQSGSNVGIGTASPASTLEVAGTAQIRGAAGVTGLVVNSSGNVGIGVASPGQMLEVSGNAIIDGTLFVPPGTSTLPGLTIANHTDNGISIQAGTIYLTTAGAPRLTLNSTASTFSGNVFFPVGSVANPSIQIGGSDNGLSAGGTSGSLVFTTQNTERMRIQTSTGNVGIGTSAPASALEVAGTAQIRGAAGVTGLLVNSSGVTGIGTTSPNSAALLDVFSTTKGILPPRMTTAQRNLISVGTAQIGLTVYNTDNAELESYDGVAYGWEAVGAYAQDAAGSNGQVQFNSSGSMNADSNFTWDNSNKRLGIGTTSPLSSLSVNGGAAIGTYAGLNAAGANNLIVSGNVGIGTTTIANKLDINGAASVGYVNTAAPSSGLIVSGNVGIGSTSPATKLDVSGVVRAGSGVQFGDGTTQTTAGGLSGGTTNEMAMWTGTASIGTANIYQSSGNIGIGSSSPVATLDIGYVSPGPSMAFESGSGRYTKIQSGNTDGTLTFTGGTDNNSSTKAAFIFNEVNNSNGTTAIGTRPSFDIQNGGTSRFFIDANGNVGIGTATIANKLDINGAASVGYVNTAAPSSGLIVSGNVGIGTTALATGAKLDVAGPVKVAGTNSETCSAATAGMMRYNSSGGYMEICQ